MISKKFKIKAYMEGYIDGMFDMQELINKKLLEQHDLEFVTISKKEVKDYIKTGKWRSAKLE